MPRQHPLLLFVPVQSLPEQYMTCEPEGLATLHPVRWQLLTLRRTISGAVSSAIAHAQASSRHSRSCQMATNVKMAHTLAARQRRPPSGTYMYRTSQRL
jgi:hypothetical protein